MFRTNALIGTALAILTTAVTTQATLVTWQFEANVTTVNDTYNLLGGTVGTGDLCTATLVMDTTAPDSWSDPQSGNYHGAAVSISGQLGIQSFDNSPLSLGNVKIWDDSSSSTGSYDEYFLTMNCNLPGAVWGLNIWLADSDALIFNGDDIPTVPPDLGQLELAKIGFYPNTSDQAGGEVFADIVSLVPEPGTLTTMVGTLLILIGRPHRYRQ